MLELDSITKRFGEAAPALDALSLRLARGEFLSLLGPSGCGKSTTLAIIAGFLDPDAGRIRVDGRDVGELPPRRRGLGLVFQDYALFTSLSVRANLAFGLEAQGVPRAERRRRLEELARRLDLGGLLGRSARSLNMSEMQRVAVGRALITRPALLLLDEPMSNLDAHLRQRLRTELKQIQAELGQTVLYVTHDQAEAMSMSDRIAVMRGGRLQQVGTPEEIYHRPVNRFVAEFIGDPPINLVPCTVRPGTGGAAVSSPLSPASSFQPGLSPMQGEHLLALRAHDIRAVRAPGGAAGVPAKVRFVENLGAQHVLHVELAGSLVRVVTTPGLAAEGDTLHLTADLAQAHLIEAATGEVVRASGRRELAA